MKPQKIAAKRISFYVPEDWHKKIKRQSLDQNISMKKWILDAITEKFKKERELGWD